MMAAHIGPADGPVLDVGCGPMWLKQFLPEGVAYIGLDYRSRGEGSIVCDLNLQPLPQTGARTFFISGCLEYLEKPEAFIADVGALGRKCIVSYCGLEDFPDIAEREKRGWKNNLTIPQLMDLFGRNGMHNRFLSYTKSRNAVMVFERAAFVPR